MEYNREKCALYWTMIDAKKNVYKKKAAHFGHSSKEGEEPKKYPFNAIIEDTFFICIYIYIIYIKE